MLTEVARLLQKIECIINCQRQHIQETAVSLYHVPSQGAGNHKRSKDVFLYLLTPYLETRSKNALAFLQHKLLGANGPGFQALMDALLR